MEEIWTQLDLEASKQQQRTYIDPQSGYRVFTTYGLLQRKTAVVVDVVIAPLVTEKFQMNTDKKFVKPLD